MARDGVDHVSIRVAYNFGIQHVQRSGMNDFPLSPFLAKLQAEGFAIGIDDYDRITRVLRTGDPWTLSRFRGVLRALLAKSPEQMTIFERVFDGFFASDVPLPSRAEVVEKTFALEFTKEPDQGPASPPLVVTRLARIARLRRSISQKIAAVFRIVKPAVEIAFVIVLLAMIAAPLLWFTRCPPTSTGVNQVVTDTTKRLDRRPQLLAPANGKPVAQGEEIQFDWTAASGASSYDLLFFRGGWFPVRENIARDSITLPRPAEGDYQWKVRANFRGLPSAESETRTFTVKPPDATWPYIVAGFAFLFGFSILLGHLLVLRGRGVVPEAIFDPAQPRLFPIESIGGLRPRYLDARTIDGVVRRIHQVLDAEESERLDLDETVRQTARAAGVPMLEYERHRSLKIVYVLEDAHATPRAWNGIASELAEGLARRNIVVRKGYFFGAPDRFVMSDGDVLTLREFGTRSDHLLLLLFSDGKHLRPRRDAASLDTLAAMHGLAWLDLRDRRFWDASADLVARHRIPLFPATAAGVLEVMQTLMARASSAMSRPPRRRAIVPDSRIEAQIEQTLGDALPWAQACAMIHPIPLALAEQLRRQFYSHLPPERIDLLFRLPDSRWDVSGVHLSWPVLNVLRSGFATRRSEARQSVIVRAIVDEVRKVEPIEKGSLRHLTWEWMLTRLEMEIDPDRAMVGIEKLLRTPLARFVQGELSHVGAPDAALTDDRVPLLRYPSSPEARRILHKLAPDTQMAVPQEERRITNRLRRLHAPTRAQLARNPAWLAWCEAAVIAVELLMYFPYPPGTRNPLDYERRRRAQSRRRQERTTA